MKNGERIPLEGFDFSVKMNPVSNGETRGLIEIYFRDGDEIPNDFLLAADYPDKTLRDISVSYAYSLNGKQLTSDVEDLSVNLKKAIGGAGFRQPFPNGATNRRLIFEQNAGSGMNGLSAQGYIAFGNELHHCNVADGVLESINARKVYRIGTVQLLCFTFQAGT